MPTTNWLVGRHELHPHVTLAGQEWDPLSTIHAGGVRLRKPGIHRPPSVSGAFGVVGVYETDRALEWDSLEIGANTNRRASEDSSRRSGLVG